MVLCAPEHARECSLPKPAGFLRRLLWPDMYKLNIEAQIRKTEAQSPKTEGQRPKPKPEDQSSKIKARNPYLGRISDLNHLSDYC